MFAERVAEKLSQDFTNDVQVINSRSTSLNKIAIILASLGFPYFFVFYSIGYPKLSWLIIFFVFCYSLCILANNYGFYKLATYGIIFFPSLAIFVYGSSLGEAAGIQFALLGVGTIPFVFFSQNHVGYIVSGFLIPLVIFLLLEATNYDNFYSVPLSDGTTKIIYLISILSTFSIIFLSMLTFLHENKKFSKILVKLIDDLKETNGGLEKAYSDLKESKSIAEDLSKQSAAYAMLTKGIAHEIKNPLQMMSSRSEWVLDHLDDRSAIEKFANIVVASVERLSKLISSMLGYGIVYGAEKELFNITDVVEDIYVLSQHKCKEMGLQMSVDLSEKYQVKGNKVFIYQALLNLVVNAIQYRPRGGTITISMEADTYDDSDHVTREGVALQITDTGTGMTEEELKEIFVPYYTTKKTKENTGLGLAMVFKTIMDNNGMIDVSSTKGVGTTFRVCLPRE